MTLIANKLTTGVPILLYHRVAESQTDPQLLCVSPKHFYEHLEILKKSLKSVSLDKLITDKNKGLIHPNQFAITFDDGYKDNFFNAKPILNQLGIEATVFITGINIGNSREFWWDELERIIFKSKDMPNFIEVVINGSHYCWKIEDDNNLSNIAPTDFKNWDITKTNDLTSRQSMYRSLCTLMHPLNNGDCEKVLDELREHVQIAPDGRLTHQTMTVDEIVSLVNDGLIKIGGHTMTHSVLSSLPVDCQLTEILTNKKNLEAIIGKLVEGFSYPYGTKNDFNISTKKIVQEVGYKYACANYPGQVRRFTSPYELPRFVVRDWDGDEFEKQLIHFLAQ